MIDPNNKPGGWQRCPSPKILMQMSQHWQNPPFSLTFCPFSSKQSVRSSHSILLQKFGGQTMAYAIEEATVNNKKAFNIIFTPKKEPLTPVNVTSEC